MPLSTDVIHESYKNHGINNINMIDYNLKRPS